MMMLIKRGWFGSVGCMNTHSDRQSAAERMYWDDMLHGDADAVAVETYGWDVGGAGGRCCSFLPAGLVTTATTTATHGVFAPQSNHWWDCGITGRLCIQHVTDVLRVRSVTVCVRLHHSCISLFVWDLVSSLRLVLLQSDTKTSYHVTILVLLWELTGIQLRLQIINSWYYWRFLSRVSTLTRDIYIAVLSVSLSVRNTLVLYENNLTYRHSFSPHGSANIHFLPASNIFTKFRRGHPLRGR